MNLYFLVAIVDWHQAEDLVSMTTKTICSRGTYLFEEAETFSSAIHRWSVWDTNINTKSIIINHVLTGGVYA